MNSEVNHNLEVLQNQKTMPCCFSLKFSKSGKLQKTQTAFGQGRS